MDPEFLKNTSLHFLSHLLLIKAAAQVLDWLCPEKLPRLMAVSFCCLLQTALEPALLSFCQQRCCQYKAKYKAAYMSSIDLLPEW